MTRRTMDFATVVSRPAAFYGTPEEVLSDPRLDREGKRAILKKWEQDARSTDDAGGGADRDMLRRVSSALGSVASPPPEGRRSKPQRRSPLVRDVMEPTDEVLHHDHSVDEALLRMRERGLAMIPVVDGDEIVGMFEGCDISRERQSAEGAAPVAVRDCMSQTVLFCYVSDDVRAATKVMRQGAGRWLVVLNENRQQVGVLSAERAAAALADARIEPSQAARSDVRTASRTATSAGISRYAERGRPKSYSAKPKVRR